tara:strand:- start:1168 stop:1536 length:369 start_codon:yes stop_codon:yes gene_type:complete
MSFLKQIFTWWHRQTFGTFVYTLIAGKFVGEDEFGNKYYSDAKGKKRWVIYKNRVESTKIPPNWHSWIHFQTKNKPNLNAHFFPWQKKHEENLTGTQRAHKPDGSMLNNEKKDMKKYETWKN